MAVSSWQKPAAITGGSVLFLGVLLVSVFSGAGPSSGPSVQVEKASRRSITARVKATGEITAATKVPISTKVMGEIVALPVKEGQEVRTGDVLLQIERQQFESARDQAASALEQSEVAIRRLTLQVEVAKKNLDRSEELKAKGFGSDSDLENAQVAYSSAQVELESQQHAVEQARSMLGKANDDLARTTVRSPIDGEVIQLDCAKGETAIPGTTNLAGSQLMTIGDMRHLVAEVDVSEGDVVRLAPGQKAQIVVDALGDDEPLAGTVSEIAASGRKDPATGVVKFRVKVALEHPDPVLHPSMTAKVNVLTAAREGVLSIPIQAVVRRRLGDDGRELDELKDKTAWSAAEDRDVVYVVKDGKARVTPVSTGTSDELRVEITHGLDDGDPVVIGPYRTLKELRDGTAVSPESVASASPHASAPAKPGA